METVPDLPANLTDEEHARALIPRIVLNRRKVGTDPVLAAKGDRLMEIRQDNLPMTVTELEAAKNRAVREMTRRLAFMKPQEVIAAVSVLDAELSARRVIKDDKPAQIRKTREEILREMQGEKQKEVQG